MNIKKITAFIVSLAMCSSISGCTANRSKDSGDSNSQSSSSKSKSKNQSSSEEPENDETYDEDEYEFEEIEYENDYRDAVPSHKGETITYKNFSFDEISHQCSSCQKVLEYRVSMFTAFEHILNLDPNKSIYMDAADELQDRIYSGMQHNCTAETYYVENLPMIMGHRKGEYTGYWKGAGPSGQGTFIGKDVYTSDLNGIVYRYTGEWNYGLPDGEGQLIYSRNDEFYTFANVYSGSFSKGIPNGYGITYKQEWDGGEIYFDEGYFENGELVGQTSFAEYNSSGKLLGTGTAEVSVDEYMSMNVVSYDKAINVKNALAVAGICAAVITGLYLGGSSSGSNYGTSPEQQMAELQKWRDEKSASNEAECAAQSEREEQYKQYCRSRYEELHAADSSDYSLDAQYFKANMN